MTVASNSGIEWTDATWNCLAGCQAVSPGCRICYAATMTRRLEAMGQKDYAGLTTKKHFNGVVRCLPDKLTIPLRWKKPRRVFVNSMSDLFHEDVPDEFIDRVFAVMALCPQHTFQVLTKRAERMREYATSRTEAQKLTAAFSIPNPKTGGICDVTEEIRLSEWYGGVLPNVWLGVSAEDQQRASERIPLLMDTPAAVRFVSAEPLLGPIDLQNLSVPGDTGFYSLDALNRQWRGRITRDIPPGALIGGLDWVIVGGESGHGAKPMHPDWARSLRDQCQRSGVAYCFKQWGAWSQVGSRGQYCFNPGASIRDLITMDRVGKKKAGRLLDGREWNEMPTQRLDRLSTAAASTATS